MTLSEFVERGRAIRLDRLAKMVRSGGEAVFPKRSKTHETVGRSFAAGLGAVFVSLAVPFMYMTVSTWRQFGLGPEVIPPLRGLGLLSFVGIAAYSTTTYRLRVWVDGGWIVIQEYGFRKRTHEVPICEIDEIGLNDGCIVVSTRFGARLRIASGLSYDDREMAARLLQSLIGDR